MAGRRHWVAFAGHFVADVRSSLRTTRLLRLVAVGVSSKHLLRSS